ncbi:hypothetical protein L915_07930 [Phytophthora nicotianae]|uniref:Uncharacterized protein n=2 Tax=Phytophthora nicotianae TaxID=4792 RepID=W2J679_PHYNI|nr:hypothetical protein L915_07930 [Phytophthora nicotianae]ETL41088.1 hypothetical protein L916_07858 [Phytophthora nicotianae]
MSLKRAYRTKHRWPFQITSCSAHTYIDSQQAAIDQSLNETQQQCEEEYRIVRVKLHGVASPLQVNISDLWEALSLINYGL